VPDLRLTSVLHCCLPNGLRYPLVGGTRQRHFAGTNSRPRKVPENAPTPTSPVHLGMMMDHHFPPKNVHLSKEDIPKGAVFEEIDAFLPIPG